MNMLLVACGVLILAATASYVWLPGGGVVLGASLAAAGLLRDAK